MYEQEPLIISKIEYNGIERTDPAFAHKIFSNLLSTSNVEEFKKQLELSLKNANDLNLFKNVSINGKESPDSDGVNLVINVEEKKLKFKAGSEIYKNDVQVGVSGQLFNINGRGMSASIGANYGIHSSAPFFLSIKSPFMDNIYKSWEGFLNVNQSRKYDIQNYDTQLASLGLRYNAYFLENMGHCVKLSVDWKHIYNITHTDVLFCRKFAGHHLLNSLSYSIFHDSRDDKVLSTDGKLWKANAEVFGPLGHVNSVKFDALLQNTIPLYRGFSLASSVRVGHIMTLGNVRDVSPLDKFYMGGPNSVRGYNTNSLGPREGNEVLGGKNLGEVSCSLASPYFGNSHLARAHFFFNSGILTNSLSIASHVFSSIGFGVQANLSGAKIEINACLPICSGDLRSSPCIQLGIGIDSV